MRYSYFLWYLLWWPMRRIRVERWYHNFHRPMCRIRREYIVLRGSWPTDRGGVWVLCIGQHIIFIAFLNICWYAWVIYHQWNWSDLYQLTVINYEINWLLSLSWYFISLWVLYWLLISCLVKHRGCHNKTNSCHCFI